MRWSGSAHRPPRLLILLALPSKCAFTVSLTPSKLTHVHTAHRQSKVSIIRNDFFSVSVTSGCPRTGRARNLRLKGVELPVVRKYFVPDVSSVTVNLSAWWPIRGHSECPHGKHFSCEDKHSLVAICYSCRKKKQIGRREGQMTRRRSVRHAGERSCLVFPFILAM